MGISTARSKRTSAVGMTVVNAGKALRRMAWLSFFAAAILMPSRIEAQSIVAPAGLTLFNRESLVRSFTEINRFSLSSSGNSVSATEYVNPLAVVYGFHPNWEVIAVQPYVVTDVTTRTAGQTQHTGLNGLADSQFFLQYDGLIHRNSPGGTTLLSGVFGVQAPTGAERFSTDAFEYTGGLIFEKAMHLKYYFTSDFEYTFVTENNQKVSVGDSARLDAAPAYMLISRQKRPVKGSRWAQNAYSRIFRNGAFLILEFNGSWQGHATTAGTQMPNSGGTSLLISPGIQFFASRTLMFEISVPVPVISEINGIQPKPDTSFLVGFRYLF